MGLGVGQIAGGIVSYAFQQVKNSSFYGWKTMFVVLGLVIVLIGFVNLFFLPDTPMKASWLSESEKIGFLKYVAINQTGVDQRKVSLKQLLEVLSDPQFWPMTILTILVCYAVDRGAHDELTVRPDLHFEWCSHDILSNAHQKFWLLAS